MAARPRRDWHEIGACAVALMRSSMVRVIGTLLVLFIPALPESTLAQNTTLRFREIASECGVAFRFDNGTRGRHDLPEVMGGGVGLLDIDGDGRLDLFFAQGGPIVPEPGRLDPPCRLYRNRGAGTFEDVTHAANAPGPRYAMGVAVGDYNGDGREDLFVTGWRDQRLYRNGGGWFEDVTAQAGLTSDLWSTSAAFADLDRDGDLDLYVATYLDYDPDRAPFCAAPDGRRDYCGPEDFPAQPDRLYRNNGDGTFTEVSKAAGILDRSGRGLGVLIADFVGEDGRPDIYVANDGTPCYLFKNLGGMRFESVGELAGVALDGQGSALAGMGVGCNDVDGDGRPDLAVGNFYGRSTVLFAGDGPETWRDGSLRWGLSTATRELTGFGMALEDFDGDGRPDLFQLNGHVLDRARLGKPFAMRPLLMRNMGTRFMDSSAAAGDWFAAPVLGRGLAIGDLDGDGRPDAVAGCLDAPAAVLKNITAGVRFVTLHLVGHKPSPREAIGARVRATVDGRVLVRHVVGGGSYLSASSRAIHLGLGQAERVDRIEVTWPSGRVQAWTNLCGNGPLRIEEATK
jgi:hypothetical protein